MANAVNHEKISMDFLFYLMLGVIVLGITMFGFYEYFTFSLPERELHYVWLPKNAEICSAADTKSGAFRVTVPLDEFKAKTGDKKVFVVYHTNRRGVVEYYRLDEGVLYYVRQELPYLYSDFRNKVNWEISFSKQPAPDGMKGVFFYTPKGKSIIFLIACFAGLFAVLWFFVFVVLGLRKNQKKKLIVNP